MSNAIEVVKIPHSKLQESLAGIPGGGDSDMLLMGICLALGVDLDKLPPQITALGSALKEQSPIALQIEAKGCNYRIEVA